jgi:hypothetical protein
MTSPDIVAAIQSTPAADAPIVAIRTQDDAQCVPASGSPAASHADDFGQGSDRRILVRTPTVGIA